MNTNTWIVVAIVVLAVFVVVFFALRPASAGGGKVAGAWMDGVLQTKPARGLGFTVTQPPVSSVDTSLNIAEIWS